MESSEIYDINPVVIPHFLSDTDCDLLIADFQQGDKAAGRLRPAIRTDVEQDSPASKMIRNNTVCWLDENERTTWIYDRVRQAFSEINESIYKFHIDNLQPIQLAQYESVDGNKGEFYRPHLDICTRGMIGQRKLSLSIQLTDPDSYEGGDLLFFGDQNDRVLDRTNLEKNLFHRRQLGSAIIFPSFLSHEVTPVTTGTRYSLVAWMEGPNWK